MLNIKIHKYIVILTILLYTVSKTGSQVFIPWTVCGGKTKGQKNTNC